MENKFVTAIIVAAGNSARMGGRISKQFIDLRGKTVIERTLCAFESCPLINEIVVVSRPCDMTKIRELAIKNSFNKISAFVPGGVTRGESVSKGINAACEKAEYFAIHDGARPLVLEKDIERVINKAFETKSATLGVAVKDTVKVVDESGVVVSTPDRSALRGVQTPQVFEKGLYLAALKKAENEGADFTDDCQLIENAGGRVSVVSGSESNLKLTTPLDVTTAESIIKAREGGESI